MSHVFAFLSFPHTTINPHWSRLAWIYVHPEKIQIWKYVHPEKNPGYMFDQKKTLDMCSPRKKANLGARNLILKGVVKNAPPCQSSSRIYPPCQRSEWELFRLWWRQHWRRCTLASPPWWVLKMISMNIEFWTCPWWFCDYALGGGGDSVVTHLS